MASWILGRLNVPPVTVRSVGVAFFGVTGCAAAQVRVERVEEGASGRCTFMPLTRHNPAPFAASGSVPIVAGAPIEPVAVGSVKGHPFAAVITMAELDSTERIGIPWQVKGVRLSRSHVVLQSRRMCHLGRKVVLAVHMIDSVPTALMGKVVGCEYTTQGKHAVAVELAVMEENPEISEWVHSLHPSRANHRIKPPGSP